MKSSSTASRLARYVPLACLSVAVTSSLVAVALARNAVPVRGEADFPSSTATLDARIAADDPRSGGGARGGGTGGARPGGGSAPQSAQPRAGIPHGGVLPPSARTTPRAHVPIRPEIGAARPSVAGRPGSFRGREFARLNPGELSTWRSGRWLHEEHGGFLGWWWVLGDEWYFYPEPIYPYPTYISDYLIPIPAPLSPQYRYYCDNPPGYYPEVQACYDVWQVVPVAPPPPLPPPPAAMANADVSAGLRIARDVCSACHIVQPGQPGGTVLVHPGPAFQEIANRPDTTRDSLRAFIQGTSWDMAMRPITMPRQGLSDRSTDQVVSYILSMKNQPPG